MAQKLRDIASEGDDRGIPIQRVGIRDLHLPLRIREKDGGYARVIGIFDASVKLPETERGTHMSRFVQILNRWSKKQVAQQEMQQMLHEIAVLMQAKTASLELTFTYFLQKEAPATHIQSPMDYDCSFVATLDGDQYDFAVVATVPILTVCPCSREISDRGAHGQRATLTARVQSAPGAILWLEDLIPLLEQQGSHEIYALLKRDDEKIVTEASYDNARFVEDVVREAIIAVSALPDVRYVRAECESIESIHNHAAYAMAESEVS
jgi:GTP cyclohydrolase I